ncbi:hypothetical protein FR943_20910 [Mycobacterium sp. TNTM28]|uniref:PE-PGRS family protein n=1 Tax=[Mycobacterium] fortunisiensis TaxID=2600579 RepID=A0ABS6KS36_9MYCO|nr:hypothetical protein [[Mycobacterium] fortunisiensis]MBU9766294.1 hypothetical protein [[Mycobacterium] fortunisiensis]
MRQALRPYVTAGLAIAGAGIIAVGPISIPDTGTHSVEFSSVHLAAAELPGALQPLDDSQTAAEAYQQLIVLTGAFLSAALVPVVENPAPILSQLLANQFEYLNYLAVGVAYGAGNGVLALGELPGVLINAAAQMGTGDAEAAIQTLWTFVEHTALQVVSPFMQSLTIPGMIAQNIANVVTALPMMALDLGLNAFETISNTMRTTATAVQDVIEAAAAGDPLAAADAIVSAPAHIATALLVGDIADGGETVGLINGLLTSFVQARETIAEALGAPPRETSEAAAARPTTAAATGEVAGDADDAATDTASAETTPAGTSSDTTADEAALPAEPETTTNSESDAGPRTAPLVRNSAKAVPGKTGLSTEPAGQTPVPSSLSTGSSATGTPGADAEKASNGTHKPGTRGRHDKRASAHSSD